MFLQMGWPSSKFYTWVGMSRTNTLVAIHVLFAVLIMVHFFAHRATQSLFHSVVRIPWSTVGL